MKKQTDNRKNLVTNHFYFCVFMILLHTTKTSIMSALKTEISKILHEFDEIGMVLEAQTENEPELLSKYNQMGHELKDVFDRAIDKIDKLERDVEYMRRRFDQYDFFAEYRDHIANFRTNVICRALGLKWHEIVDALVTQKRQIKLGKRVNEENDMQLAIDKIVVQNGMSSSDWHIVWQFADTSNSSFHQGTGKDLRSSLKFLEDDSNQLYDLEHTRQPFIKMLKILIKQQKEEDSVDNLFSSTSESKRQRVFE